MKPDSLTHPITMAEITSAKLTVTIKPALADRVRGSRRRWKRDRSHDAMVHRVGHHIHSKAFEISGGAAAKHGSYSASNQRPIYNVGRR